MKNLLIADAGSTKIAWAHCQNNDITVYKTKGFNPVAQLASAFEIPEIPDSRTIEIIQYYGSGIISEDMAEVVRNCLSKIFINAHIEIHEDTLGAARATLGKDSGGICILGTGSNSAFYDGNRLHNSIPSLGYILGDEGAGVDIGKRIIRSFFYQQMPGDIRKRFEEDYNLSRSDLLHQLKTSSAPSKYLASFTSFLSGAKGNWKKNLLLNSFNSFLEVRKSDLLGNEKNCFIGSIAYNFQEELKEACKRHNIKIFKIIKDPLDGLITYHIQELL